MSEFKGTKWKWEFRLTGSKGGSPMFATVYQETDRGWFSEALFRNDHLLSDDRKHSKEEIIANLKLASKAPEMFEFIKDHHRFLNLDDQKKAERLLKEATTI